MVSKKTKTVAKATLISSAVGAGAYFVYKHYNLRMRVKAAADTVKDFEPKNLLKSKRFHNADKSISFKKYTKKNTSIAYKYQKIKTSAKDENKSIDLSFRQNKYF